VPSLFQAVQLDTFCGGAPCLSNWTAFTLRQPFQMGVNGHPYFCCPTGAAAQRRISEVLLGRSVCQICYFIYIKLIDLKMAGVARFALYLGEYSE
jgi:hypothetical protein